jgi:hypothetical protein
VMVVWKAEQRVEPKVGKSVGEWVVEMADL